VSSLVVCLCTTALAEPVRLAVVSPGNRAASPVLDLVFVKLASVPELQLLEREQAASLLAERTLQLAGLTHSADVCAAGKALGVQLLAVVGSTGKGPDAAATVVVYNAENGWRLADAGHSGGTAETLADAVVQDVTAALAKWRNPAAAVRLIVTPSRNVNLPLGEFTDLDRTLRRLLTRRLVAAPNAVVLEREHLDQVATESLLAGAGKDLFTSAWQVSLVLGREGGPEGTTLLLWLQAVGKEGREVLRAPVTAASPGAAVEIAVKGILGAVQAAPPPPPADPNAEAAQFRTEAVYLYGAGMVEDALAAAQAAQALAPVPAAAELVSAYRLLLSQAWLHERWKDKGALAYVAATLPDEVDALLASAQAAPGLGRFWKSPAGEMSWEGLATTVHNLAVELDPRRAQEGVVFADLAAVREARKQCRRFAVSFLRRRLELAAVAGQTQAVFIDPFLAITAERPGGTFPYTAGCILHLCVDRPDAYPEELFAAGRSWLERPGTAEAAALQFPAEQVTALLSLIDPTGANLLNFQPPVVPAAAVDRAAWEKHLAFLEAHADPLVAAVGAIGQFRSRCAAGSLTPEATAAESQKLFARLLTVGKDAPSPALANRAWAACQILLPSISVARLHEDVDTRHVDLLEAMAAASQEPDWKLAARLVQILRPADPEAARHMLAVLAAAETRYCRHHPGETSWDAIQTAQRELTKRFNLAAAPAPAAAAPVVAAAPAPAAVPAAPGAAPAPPAAAAPAAAPAAPAAAGTVTPWSKAECVFQVPFDQKALYHRGLCTRVVLGEEVGYVLMYVTYGGERSPGGFANQAHLLRFRHAGGTAEEMLVQDLTPEMRVTAASIPPMVLTDSGQLCVGLKTLVLVPPQGNAVRQWGPQDGLPGPDNRPLAALGETVLLASCGWGSGGPGQTYFLTLDAGAGALKTIYAPGNPAQKVPPELQQVFQGGPSVEANREAKCFELTGMPPMMKVTYAPATEQWAVVRPAYKSMAEAQAATMAAMAKRAPPPCLIGPWRWQIKPFGRLHTQSGAVERFPDQIAGTSMENVWAFFRHGNDVYILTLNALLRVTVDAGP
jgi:hypothetical protein